MSVGSGAGKVFPAMNDGTQPAALDGLKVLDLTRVRAGPTAARQLADWGADVLMIEAPESLSKADSAGRDTGPTSRTCIGTSAATTLNLKHPEGLAILRRLIEDADVLLENYRPDVKFRLGIDYESLAAINPRLIYASVSGFGQDGPYRERPGFDQIAQGMGGLMSITGLPGQGPVRAGIAIADLGAGHFAAMGILLAADRAHALGTWPVGPVLAAAGADRASGLPGGSLAGGWRGARTSRQRSPDQHSNRSIPHGGRSDQHRGRQPGDLRAFLRCHRRKGYAARPTLPERGAEVEEPRSPERRHRR